MIKDYIIFDTETSGLSSIKHEILSISGMRFDFKTGELTDEFYSLLQPTSLDTLSSEALQINGLSLKELLNAPARLPVLKEFVEFLSGDCPIMAYNAPFDIRMLEASLAKFPKDIPKSVWPRKTRYVDLLPMVKNKRLPIQSHKLGMVCECLGYSSDKKFHNAAADVLATNFVFRRLFLNEESPAY